MSKRKRNDSDECVENTKKKQKKTESKELDCYIISTGEDLSEAVYCVNTEHKYYKNVINAYKQLKMDIKKKSELPKKNKSEDDDDGVKDDEFEYREMAFYDLLTDAEPEMNENVQDNMDYLVSIIGIKFDMNDFNGFIKNTSYGLDPDINLKMAEGCIVLKFQCFN